MAKGESGDKLVGGGRKGYTWRRASSFKLGGQSRAVTAGGQFSGITDITHTENYGTARAFKKQKHEFFTRENSSLQKWILESLQEKTFVCAIHVKNHLRGPKNKTNPADSIHLLWLLPQPHHKPANTTGSGLPQGSSRIQNLKLLLWIIAPKWTLTGMQAGLSQSACRSASNGSQPEAILG